MAKTQNSPTLVKSEKKAPTRITCTLGEIEVAVPALRKLVQRELPAKQGYHIAKLARLIQRESDLFEQRVNKLCEELGELKQPTEESRAKGLTVPYHQVPPEKMDLYHEKLKDLRAVEVTLNWGPIPIEWFESSTLAAIDIMLLGPFLDGELR